MFHKMMIERRGMLKMILMMMLFSVMLAACSNDDDLKLVSAPDLNTATDVKATSFKASWKAVSSAEKYLLDVSLKADFSTTVAGYSKKEVTGTNTVISGLTSATKYYYRVYAKTGGTVSASSSVKETVTL